MAGLKKVGSVWGDISEPQSFTKEPALLNSKSTLKRMSETKPHREDRKTSHSQATKKTTHTTKQK